MENKQVGRAVHFHGAALLEKLSEEQQEDAPNTTLLRGYLAGAENDASLKEIRSDDYQKRLCEFIAKKSDMLFRPKSEKEKNDELKVKQSIDDAYAIMPPIEVFMGIIKPVRLKHFYESLHKDDCLTGSVCKILENGLLIRLICVDLFQARNIQDLDVMAYCPAKELPKLVALDSFEERDVVRGIVMSVDIEAERIILSMSSKSIPDELAYPRIGLITDVEFPVHQKRISQIQDMSYDEMLHSVLGFNNDGNVEALVNKLDIPDSASYLRFHARLKIPEKEYAEGLKKWQSQKLAHQSVAQGVEYFKQGREMEAMQHFSRALQIDAENVEALVARGALYANKESFKRAIQDFENALAANPKHNNARNYLVETLLSFGKSCEDEGDPEEACVHYQHAMTVDATNREAQDLLATCQRILKKRVESREEQSKSVLSRTTEKLKQMINQEKKVKPSSKKKGHKDREGSSSSSSSSGRNKSRRRSSSSSSSSYDRKHKSGSGKKKLKRKRRSSSTSGSDRQSRKDKALREPVATEAAGDKIEFLLKAKDPSTTSLFPVASSDLFNKSTAIPGLGSPEPPGVGGGETLVQVEPKDAQTKPGRSLSDARQSRAHRSSSSERSGSRSKKSKRNGSRSRSSSPSHRRKRSPSDASIEKRSKAKSLRDKTGATELDMYLGNVLQSRPQKNEKNILSEWDSFMKHKEKGKPKRTSRSRSRSSSSSKSSQSLKRQKRKRSSSASASHSRPRRKHASRSRSNSSSEEGSRSKSPVSTKQEERKEKFKRLEQIESRLEEIEHMKRKKLSDKPGGKMSDPSKDNGQHRGAKLQDRPDREDPDREAWRKVTTFNRNHSREMNMSPDQKVMDKYRKYQHPGEEEGDQYFRDKLIPAARMSDYEIPLKSRRWDAPKGMEEERKARDGEVFISERPKSGRERFDRDEYESAAKRYERGSDKKDNLKKFEDQEESDEETFLSRRILRVEKKKEDRSVSGERRNRSRDSKQYRDSDVSSEEEGGKVKVKTVRKPIMDDPNLNKPRLSSNQLAALEKEKRKNKERTREDSALENISDEDEEVEKHTSKKGKEGKKDKKKKKKKSGDKKKKRRSSSNYEEDEDKHHKKKHSKKRDRDSDDEEVQNRSKKGKPVFQTEEDLEKEIERRVRERLMLEESKLKKGKETNIEKEEESTRSKSKHEAKLIEKLEKIDSSEDEISRKPLKQRQIRKYSIDDLTSSDSEREERERRKRRDSSSRSRSREHKARSDSDSDGAPCNKYIELNKGWTRDAQSNMYYAIFGEELEAGWHEDKHGNKFLIKAMSRVQFTEAQVKLRYDKDFIEGHKAEAGEKRRSDSFTDKDRFREEEREDDRGRYRDDRYRDNQDNRDRYRDNRDNRDNRTDGYRGGYNNRRGNNPWYNNRGNSNYQTGYDRGRGGARGRAPYNNYNNYRGTNYRGTNDRGGYRGRGYHKDWVPRGRGTYNNRPYNNRHQDDRSRSRRDDRSRSRSRSRSHSEGSRYRRRSSRSHSRSRSRSSDSYRSRSSGSGSTDSRRSTSPKQRKDRRPASEVKPVEVKPVEVKPVEVKASPERPKIIVEETEPSQDVRSILKKDAAPTEQLPMDMSAIPIPPDPPSGEAPGDPLAPSKWEEVPVGGPGGDALGGPAKGDLTDLEKFLKNLKTNKKKQWIAEGKVKEDE